MDEGGSVDEASLSVEAPWRGPQGGASFVGDPARNVKKVSGYGHLSPWGPFYPRGTCYVGGGSYTGDFDR
jgi:hypothetical protein